jgi:hypothetical protein
VKNFIYGAAISTITAACFFAAFVAAAMWIPQDQPAIRGHVVAAIVDGTFNARFRYGPFGGLVWPRHTLDCVAASMMVAPPVERWVQAISNRMPVINPSWHDTRVPETLDCQALARALPELGADYGDVQFEPHDRYIFGIRVFARALLSVMPLDIAAQLMRGVAFALLGGVGLLAVWKLRCTQLVGNSPLLPVGYLVIAGGLALLYGVHYFDATLLFAPPDYVHFIFILISLAAPLARMRTTSLSLYAASYGSLTAIFETLTGGIPFALAMLPLLLALGFEGKWRLYAAKLIQLWVCFCLAVLACFVIKKAFTMAFLGDQESFTHLLFYRMYGAVLPASGVDLSLRYLLSAYRIWSRLIALGSSNIGTGLVLGALSIFIVQTWRTLRLSKFVDRPILIACWLGVAVLLLWCAAFLNHSAVHPYFMARLLAIPVIGAALLLTAHWIPRHGTWTRAGA